jgi:glycosyltransferase involved in cell wall biosynthesis
MLSIREANALAQRGDALGAASTYARLLFVYPDLAWSTIVGLRRCVNTLRRTKEWEESQHAMAATGGSLNQSNPSDQEAAIPSVDEIITQACNHPCAKLVYHHTFSSSSDLFLALLHRQLWQSQLIFPLPLAFSKISEVDRYVAKKPIWSNIPQGNESAFLLRLASLSESWPPEPSTAPSHHGFSSAGLHQVGGPACPEEIDLLRDLISACSEDKQVEEMLLTLVQLLSQSGGARPTAQSSKATPQPDQQPVQAEVSASWMEEAVKRGLFCETFYRRTNPDLSPDTDLRLHYKEHGWREGRDPSQFFSTNQYLEIYADVAASGMNPLRHYVKHGSDRSRFPSKIFERERTLHSDAVELALLNIPDDFNPNQQKIALLLHIHYPDVLHDILPILISSVIDYDLLITATSEIVASEVHAVAAEYPLRGRIHVRVVTNRGRDIAAFINEFTDLYLNYDLICKIHGKKSPHLDHFGRSWRQYLISHTIGNDDIVRRITYFFSICPRLGVFAPVPFKGTDNSNWADNLEIAKALVAALDPEAAERLGEQPLSYPSATVFWFRPQSLTELYGRYPTESFPSEPLPVDGTSAHALERLIPYFAGRSGYEFGCYRHRRSILEWSVEYPILTFLQAQRPRERRKVLLFSHDASNTGAPRTAIGLHRALNSSGEVDCLAVVLGGGPLEDRFHEAGPSLILPNGIRLDVLSDILEIAPRDVTLICNTVVTAEVGDVARNFGLHTISLVHEYASSGFWPKDLFRKALEADVCVFPGTSVLEAAVSYCGKIPAQTCLLRPQGLYRDDFPRFLRSDVRDLVLRELNLSSDTILIMACGMLESRKGFDLFLETAQHMLRNSTKAGSNDAPLAFLWVGGIPPGEAEETKKHLAQIETCPDLSRSVYLLGQVLEADRYFAAADIFYLSSRFDPFPGVVLEAMAAGMPIVCFRQATDVTDAFMPPCGGFALDQVDAKKAAEALEKLVANPSLRMEMGDFARRRVRSHYSFASYINTLTPYLFTETSQATNERCIHSDNHPIFSIIVPAFRTPLTFLQQLIHSVLIQTYPHFELVIAGSELEPLVSAYLQSMANIDPRIKPSFLEKNMGIAGNTNAALQQGNGTHICFLDHDDLLHAHCLQRVADIILQANPDFIYTDEDKVDSSGSHFHSPVRKPGFDLNLLERNNYITHFTVVNKNIVTEIGGVRSDYDGAQDYDFILRATDAAKSVWHIPEVLYHWRESEQSTSSGHSTAKPYAVNAGRRALEDHLHRLGRHDEIVENSDQPFVYRIIRKSS